MLKTERCRDFDRLAGIASDGVRKGARARYEAVLRGLSRKDRLRSLAPRSGIDFSSNDYLALAGAPRLRDAVIAALTQGTPIGAGGSRLLRGNCREHEALEAQAADFFGAESALFFASGYIANFAVLTTLPQKGDLILLDALVHASIHEGARAGRADRCEFPHSDADAIESAIVRWRAAGGKGRIFIVVESLYSMDGDFAPLADLVGLAKTHDAFLVVDEAHATGVYGTDGRGLAATYEGRGDVIAVHTCGKALGVAGALVTGPRVLCDFMINRCRPFIYSTAPSPLMAVAVKEALMILAEEPERRRRLAGLVDLANGEIAARGLAPASGSQILPVIVGDNRRAMALAAALRARGFDIRGVRPPTVPEGTARLRISLTLNVDTEAVHAMLAVLAEEIERMGG